MDNQDKKVCIKCGHPVCDHCGDWCDVVLYSPQDKGNHCEQTSVQLVISDKDDDYPKLCCDGECTYE